MIAGKSSDLSLRGSDFLPCQCPEMTSTAICSLRSYLTPLNPARQLSVILLLLTVTLTAYTTFIFKNKILILRQTSQQCFPGFYDTLSQGFMTLFPRFYDTISKGFMTLFPRVL